MEYVELDPICVSPLFVGLTLPAMILGVTMDFFGIAATIMLCGFILFSSPVFILVYIPVHVFGAAMCAHDSSFFRVITKNLMCNRIPNFNYWGCQSYDPF